MGSIRASWERHHASHQVRQRVQRVYYAKKSIELDKNWRLFLTQHQSHALALLDIDLDDLGSLPSAAQESRLKAAEELVKKCQREINILGVRNSL